MTKEYREINLPNVEMVIPPRTDGVECVAGPYPFMHPFIEALAVKHPEWKFVGTDYRTTMLEGTSTIATVYRRFAVHAGKELLGHLWQDYSYGRRKDMYVIKNHRTEEALIRANAIKTSDVGKAVKLVEKMFYALTTKELMEQKLKEVYKAAEDLTSNKMRQAGYAEREVRGHIMGYVRAHLDAVMLNIPDSAGRARLQEYFTFSDEAKILHNVIDVLQSYKGHKIIQRGSVYYAAVRDGDGVKELTNEDLTEPMKHKLGILKLVEDGQAVENVGFRHSNDTFILFGDEA
jgi:hypothetical protein